MIQMKKRYLIPTIFMGIAVGFCLTVPKQTATAAIYVEDIKNIAENAKTAINTYTNAINTAKQVSLMIQDLTSMDPKALIAHYTGLDKEYKNLMNDLDSQIGTLDKDTSTDSILSERMGIDIYTGGYTKPVDLNSYTQNIKKLYHVADETYYSALSIGRRQQEVENSINQLETSLQNLSKAQGTKEAMQASGQIASQNTMEAAKTNALLSTLLSVTATEQLQENAQKQAGMKINENMAIDVKNNSQKVLSNIEMNKQQNIEDYKKLVGYGL
ncbi:hypothetical protein [Megamonas funiformis]|uniref:hypothetical protein n=1 Tax=Megamonas funiformis TaxID=437897 RepID=UPI001CD7F4B0|nr:hypothetical protein [Megamonas funiformis]UBS48670.1 hypothetical protein LCQ45_11140 [Megamonas funiformis]GLU97957.1 hypothetical protein Mfun01_06020 [Megamonas funiformis]